MQEMGIVLHQQFGHLRLLLLNTYKILRTQVTWFDYSGTRFASLEVVCTALYYCL